MEAADSLDASTVSDGGGSAELGLEMKEVFRPTSERPAAARGAPRLPP